MLGAPGRRKAGRIPAGAEYSAAHAGIAISSGKQGNRCRIMRSYII
jgi:hypothetical protein